MVVFAYHNLRITIYLPGGEVCIHHYHRRTKFALGSQMMQWASSLFVMIVLEKMVVDHYSMPEQSIEVIYLKNTISVLGNYYLIYLYADR